MARGVDMPTGGSTDMGNVSHVVPAIHPFLAIDAGEAVNHQPEFAAATITPSGDKTIRDGALAMAWTVIDLAVGDRWDELKG
jgi:metal-dependent amidase/aminoacylase/carboxypeptidase family protein